MINIGKNKKKKNYLKMKINTIIINCEIVSSWLNPTKIRKILIVGSKKIDII